MFIKKTRRKRSDGPTHSGGFGQTEGRRWVPTPYTGRFQDGRRTWITEGMIRFEIGDLTVHVAHFPLAELLNELGITDGDQRDWIRHPRVLEWVWSYGVREDRDIR